MKQVYSPDSVVGKLNYAELAVSKISQQDAQLAEFSSAQLSPGVDVSAVELRVDKVDARQRQISASINLPYTTEQVWQVLTDYDALADFIPNLAKSQRVPHPNGGIRIEQVGVQKVVFLDFSARVVLDMEEDFPQEIRFSMVEGDFRAFSGSWQLKEWSVDNQSGTTLTYTVLVWPKRTMPIAAVQRRISSDLPLNLMAILERSHKLFNPQIEPLPTK